MARLAFDPSLIPCPDFTGPSNQPLRQALISDAATADVTNEEEAAAHLRQIWETDNAALRAQYQLQVEADLALVEQRKQQEEDARKLEQEQLRKKEEESRLEMEKKRTPLYGFSESAGITSIREQLHPYAKKQMTARKYCPLWYFLPEASREAADIVRHSTDESIISIGKDSGGKLAFQASSASRTSPNAIPDIKLSWKQISAAKNAFLGALHLGNYPDSYITMFSAFYVNMEMAPELREEDGEAVMALYHAWMRQEWYDRNEQGSPFNLALISPEVLARAGKKIDKASLKAEIDL
ncbi:hypothetical protein BDZ89DRAFT_1261279 [Hymenopellis radicata]|nr:hypothetical protein BDZ89DRAFT_1261279 [Hymenopellis radicata]